MGECRTGESRTRVVVDEGELWTWGSCKRGGSCSVGESWCGGVVVCGSYGVWEPLCVGATMCGSDGVWEL
mgnify:CR=1 FL=1